MDLLEYVATHKRDPKGDEWSYSSISANRKVTEKLIEMYPGIKWDPWGLTANPSLSVSYLMPYYHADKRLNNQIISSRPTTLGQLQHYGLDTTSISFCCNLPLEEISNHEGHFLSQNRHLTFEYVLAHPEISWWWDRLSKKLTLKLTDLIAHRHLPWSWFSLSMNKSLSIDEMFQHPELPWNIDGMAINLGVTEAQILAHPKIDWNWDRQSKNRHLSLEFLLAQARNQLSHFNLSKNRGLTLSQVLIHPEIKWNWLLLVRRLGQPLYLDLLQKEMSNPASWFSTLPRDMLTYYLQLYFLY